jgi:hypothetical protein
MDRVQGRLDQGDFPDLSDVQSRDVIVGCCLERRFVDAGEVLEALAEMRQIASCRSHNERCLLYFCLESSILLQLQIEF